MDVIPQLGLKLSNTGWSKYSEGHLETSPIAKKEECWQVFCLWLTPTGSVEELTLFLPGLALLQSPRTKYSIAWLEMFRHVTRHCHIWRTSMTLLKTSRQCDARREDLENCTFQIIMNGSSTTTIEISTEAVSRKMKTSTDMTNHDPRNNRSSSIALIELTPSIVSC
jgi:hypothetical protein